MTIAAETKRRIADSVSEGILDIQWRMDVGRDDAAPDAEAWATVGAELRRLMEAAYARLHSEAS